MKKFLLTSSAIAIACAGSAQAAEWDVTVGGFFDTSLGFMNDDGDANQRPHAIRNDTEITFNPSITLDNGLKISANIQLEGDIEDDLTGDGTNASETALFIQGSFGEIILGSSEGASGRMKVDASNVARATGGISGNWKRFANNSGPETYIATPKLPLGYGIHSGGFGSEDETNTNKVTYFTPPIEGFRLGVSYAANDVDRGQTITRDNDRTAVALPDGFFSFGRAENIFSGGINYGYEHGGARIITAATFERGDAEGTGSEDLFAYNGGIQINYEGFSIAGSYGYWGDSLGATGTANDESSYWTAGGAYQTGPYGFSVTYLHSTVERGTGFGENEFSNLSIGADYQLAPGLTAYVDSGFYSADAATNANDNDGFVVIPGALIRF